MSKIDEKIAMLIDRAFAEESIGINIKYGFSTSEEDKQEILNHIINLQNKLDEIRKFAEENKMGHLGQFAQIYILSILNEKDDENEQKKSKT